MKAIPIGLQLWSLHKDCARDFSGAVAAIAEMGYAGVELAGYGNLDVNGAKAAIDAAGLQIAGIHVRPEMLPNQIDTIIDDALVLETRRVVCAWWPPSRFVSAAACQEIGERLDQIGATLRSYGLQFSYHNHDGEMRIVEGRTVLDWMLSAAQPRNLTVEIDVYWAQMGGVSPAKIIKKLGARCTLVHLKDEHEVGGGPVDFADVFAAVDSVGSVDWLIVEADHYSGTPLETVRRSLDQLRRWGRA